MHRSASVPGLAEAAAVVPDADRHPVGVTLVARAMDRAADRRLREFASILLDERQTPGLRRGAAGQIQAAVDGFDTEAHRCRAEGDFTGYILGFQAARATAALFFLVRDGSAGLADIAYESVMACGAADPVLEVLAGQDG